MNFKFYEAYEALESVWLLKIGLDLEKETSGNLTQVILVIRITMLADRRCGSEVTRDKVLFQNGFVEFDSQIE